ncbi:Acidic repeat-containing protein [Armadillidium vulgare]|nr:Acidic repeat-containing protein [Armadillidium vulgare]
MSNKSTVNSSRLSVALLDLPLTPIGMKTSLATRNIPQSTRNDHIKTSKLRLKSLQEHQNLPDLEEEKENFNFLNKMKNVSVRRNRRNKQQQDTRNNWKLPFPQNESLIQPEKTITIDSISDGRTNKRESLFTDIDEGSFVEFTEADVPAPPPSFKEKTKLLYYTCSEENETKFSTSSKVPSSPVGFHKFIDKLRDVDKFKSIAGEVSSSKKSNDTQRKFNFDESVITGSRDIMGRRNDKKCVNAVLNSTVNNQKNKVIPMFPDFSTLSLNKLETSICSNLDNNLCTNKSVEYIELSESEDDRKNCKGKQIYKSSSHSVKNQDENVPVRENPVKHVNLESSLISEDISLESTVIVQKESNNYPVSKSKSFRQDPVKHVKLESSLISEDISLASTVIVQKESNNYPVLRSKSPVNVIKSNIYDFDKQCEDENDSDDVDDRLVGWILNSPFKDSSFGTSFINDKEANLNIGKVNDGISSQSLDLRLSEDFSPGKSSGKTVFTLGRVPESPEIEDVICHVKEITHDSVIHSSKNTQYQYSNENPENLKHSFCNFMPEENLNYSEANLCQKGFTKGKTIISENKPSTLTKVNHDSFSKAADKSSSSNLSENYENPSCSYQINRKKSLSLDEVNRFSDVSIEEYPSGGELYNSYNSFILEDETCKPKHRLNHSLSKSEGELHALNAEESSNSFTSVNKTSKHTLKPKISMSKSSELNPLNNSEQEEPNILKTPSDTGNHQEEINRNVKTLNGGVHSSFVNRKMKNKREFVLQSSYDSLPDVDITDKNKSKDSNLLDDLISAALKKQLNITEGKQTKICKTENFKRGEKYVPGNKSFNSSESSDDFENYIRSVKKVTENTHKTTKNVINDSDFIVSDSDVEYLSPVRTNKTKTSTECKTYPNIREHKAIDNEWRKPPKLIYSSSSESEEDHLPKGGRKPILKRKNVKRKQIVNKQNSVVEVEKKKAPKSFLSSLTQNTLLSEAHEDAIPFIKNFRKLKEPLTTKLYKLFNGSIFDNQLPSFMDIRWNTRLRKTAGYCFYQLDKSKPMGRGSRIELSSKCFIHALKLRIKVIDAPGRLRDTLIHELCHAAAWIISGYKDGHGPIWKSWWVYVR